MHTVSHNFKAQQNTQNCPSVNKLTMQNQVIVANEQPKSYKRLSEEIKKMAVRLHYQDNKSILAISELIHVNRTTLYEFFKRYETDPDTITRKPRGRLPLLSNAQKESICDWVDEDARLTLRSLAKRCQAEFGIRVSIQQFRDQ